MRRWLTLDDVQNSKDWIVDTNLMIARHKKARPDDFFFLCSDEKRVGVAHTKLQEELLKPAMVEVNQNGNVRRMTVTQFHKEFKDWEFKPEEKTD